jgi:hypothetical protein
MVHDPVLLDELCCLPLEQYSGEVFRAVGLAADPLAGSVSGGRWAPPAGGGINVPVLYTSLDRDGALAEVVSYLVLLTPLPSKPLKVAQLSVSTSRTVRLARSSLQDLGVDMARYGERDYDRTQRIGAALAFLQIDGLIAPSARWSCDNLTIFLAKPVLGRLKVTNAQTVDWHAWARQSGFL